MRIKTGDKVKVITGKDKGKEGKVIRTMPREDKLVVEGINIATKHKKPTQTQTGGIEEFPAPIHVSNVQLIDPETGKATKVGYRVENDQKVRFAKKSNATIK